MTTYVWTQWSARNSDGLAVDSDPASGRRAVGTVADGRGAGGRAHANGRPASLEQVVASVARVLGQRRGVRRGVRGARVDAGDRAPRRDAERVGGPVDHPDADAGVRPGAAAPRVRPAANARVVDERGRFGRAGSPIRVVRDAPVRRSTRSPARSKECSTGSSASGARAAGGACRPGARTAADRARAPRRGRSDADGDRAASRACGGGRRRRRARRAARDRARRRSGASRTCAGSRASCDPRCSTTWGW